MKNNNSNVTFSYLMKQVDNVMNNYNYSHRLFYSNAIVYHGENFIVLKSYNTPVAIYDISNDTVYDFLRIVYGYTATSTQHIAKFTNRYLLAYYPFSSRTKITIKSEKDIK